MNALAGLFGAMNMSPAELAEFHAVLWIIGGVVLAALELLAPGFFLIWVGLAALGTGLLTSLLALTSEWSFVAFIGLAGALVGGVARRLRARKLVDTVNAPSAGLIGRTCIAEAFRGEEGRVTLGDGVWPARTTDATVPVTGDALRVIGLDGTTLLVTKPM